MGKHSEESRHYAQIWNKVIQQTLSVVMDESDAEFRDKCHLELKPERSWKKELESKYRMLRKDLKEICYGGNAGEGLLDGRKLAAIFCGALIEQKAYSFDTQEAYELIKEKKQKLSPVEFNVWVVRNVYINYKLAYYVSLQLVYLTLLHDLLSNEETKPLALKLNELGHLCRYPQPNDCDSFDVNVIIGMARADIMEKEFDVFLFAMQLYQVEMYTRERLKCGILD